jgi:hypothetical protein
MGNVRVYRFEYLDRGTGQVVPSTDYATEMSIRQMGATILRDTGIDVDAGRVAQPSGLLQEKAVSSDDGF